MTAALAVDLERGLVVEEEDHAHDTAIIAEDRARDLAIVAAARSGDLALADKLWSELVDQPDLAPPVPTVGPTERWRQHCHPLAVDPAKRRRRLSLATRASARTRARQRAKQQRLLRRYAVRDKWLANLPASIADHDPIAVERLAAGQIDWRRTTYGERVLAVDVCRLRGLNQEETARRLGMAHESIKKIRQHASHVRVIVRDSHREQR